MTYALQVLRKGQMYSRGNLSATQTYYQNDLISDEDE